MCLGVCERQFRRQCRRYESEGIDGLIDLRLGQLSSRRAPVDEVVRLVAQYRHRYRGWTAKHFYSKYREQKGRRSYNFVRLTLQREGVVNQAKRRASAQTRAQAAHRHDAAPGRLPPPMVARPAARSDRDRGDLLGLTGGRRRHHESFAGVAAVIAHHGLFNSLYTDRGSHYWHTTHVGGKVDRVDLTQFGRAMTQLGIEMITAYSPEARGRSERAFGTLQDRLPKELLDAAITEVATDAPPQAARVLCAELQRPQRDGFVRDLDAALEHHLLYVSEAEAEAKVQPDAMEMIWAGKR
jgi:hypothetical protein